jgi:hypothetical protein
MNNLPRPRMTKFWKSRLQIVLDAIERIKVNSEIMELYRTTRESFWDMIDSPDGKTESSIAQYQADYNALAAIVGLYEPDAAHLFGSKLERWIWVWFHNHAGVDIPANLAPVFELDHLGPDNPIELQPDGDARHTNIATAKHLHELRDYHRSFQLPGRVGRPPENIELALEAFYSYRNGKHWMEIAKEIFHLDTLPYGAERERIRGWIRRLIERGGIEHSAL